MAADTLLHCGRVLLGLEEGRTQTTEAEREMVARWARGALRAAEIGVYEGVTTCVIASVLADRGKLYAIDPFFPGRLGICYGKWIVRTALRRRGLSDKVVFLEMLSWEANRAVEGEFDFVFVDGDHSIEGIRRDWEDWSGRISPGGLIALHDTSVPAHDASVSTLGSFQYFQSHIRNDPRFERVDGVDSLNVLRRRSPAA